MAQELGSISSKFTLDISQFVESLNEVQKKINAINTNINLKGATANFHNAGREMQNSAQQTASNVNNSLNSIRDNINFMSGLIKTAILGYAGKKIFDFTIGGAGQFEQFQTSFAVMMGDADKAKVKLKELSDYANNTPFELPNVIVAGRTLMTFGLESQSWVENAGNLAAAASAPIEEVARALGRIKAGDFGEAFERLRDFGVSRTMLEGEGLVFDKNGAYKGSVETALAGIENIIKTKYGNMTAEQSKTFNGLMSTFKDAISAFGREVGEKAFPKVKEALQSLMKGFDELRQNGTLDSLSTSFGNILGGIAEYIPPIISAVSDIMTALSPVFDFIVDHGKLLLSIISGISGAMLTYKGVMMATIAIQEFHNATMVMAAFRTGGLAAAKSALAFADGSATIAQTALNVAMSLNPIAILVIAIGALVGVLIYLWKTNDKFREAVIGAWNALKKAAIDVWAAVSEAFKKAVEWLKNAGQSMHDTSIATWNKIKTKTVEIFTAVRDFFVNTWTGIKDGVKGAIEGIGNFFTNGWNAIKNGVTNTWNGIKTGISNALTAVKTTISNMIQNITQGVLEKWHAFNNKFFDQIELIKDVFTRIKDVCVNIWNAIKTTVLGIILLFLDLITGNFTKLKEDFSSILNRLKELFGSIFHDILFIIINWCTAVWETFVIIFKDLLAHAKEKLDAMKLAMAEAWENMKLAMSQAWDKMKENLAQTWENIKEAAKTAWTTLKDTIHNLITGIVDAAKTAWDNYLNYWITLYNNIKDFAINAWTSLKTRVPEIIGEIKEKAIEIFNNLLNWFKELPGRLYEYGSNMFTSMKNGVSATIHGVKEAVTTGIENAIEYLKNLPGQAVTWGKDMIQGIIDGIKSKIKGVKDAVEGVADAIRSYLHFSVPDVGPLTEYESWMPDFMHGLAQGIQGNKHLVQNAIKSLSSDMSIGVKSNVSSFGSAASVNNRTVSNNYAALLRVEKLEINNGMDIETLAQELNFFMDRQSAAKGE